MFFKYLTLVFVLFDTVKYLLRYLDTNLQQKPYGKNFNFFSSIVTEILLQLLDFNLFLV